MLYKSRTARCDSIRNGETKQNGDRRGCICLCLHVREERCEVYALLAKRGSGITVEEYAAIEDGGCPELPDS